jgi:hypothetical protein
MVIVREPWIVVKEPHGPTVESGESRCEKVSKVAGNGEESWPIVAKMQQKGCKNM